MGDSQAWDEGYHFAKFKTRCSTYEAYLLKSYLQLVEDITDCDIFIAICALQIYMEEIAIEWIQF